MAKVKRGRWIKGWCDNNLIGHEYEECSLCGYLMLDTNQHWDALYCPNCNAKMDENDRFKNSLFKPNSTQAKTLLDLIDDELEKEIVKHTVVEGLTTTETANIVGYCERQVLRIKKRCVEKIIIKALIEKQTPKEAIVEQLKYGDGEKRYTAEMEFQCPICHSVLAYKNSEIEPYCSQCGQAIRKVWK